MERHGGDDLLRQRYPGDYIAVSRIANLKEYRQMNGINLGDSSGNVHNI